MKNIISVILLALLTHPLFSQSKDEEIRRLQVVTKENEERAIKAEALAEQYKLEANQAKEMLERVRLQALGKIFSEKSIEQSDKEMAGLLALQGYSFNVRGMGYAFDSDIYAGLINALVRYDGFQQSLEFNSQLTTFIQSANGAIYSSGNADKILKWTWLNNSWKGEEVIKIKKGKISAARVSNSGKLLVISVVDDKMNSHIELFYLKKSNSDPKTITTSKSAVEQIVFAPNESGFYCLSKAGLNVLYCDLISVKEVIQSKEKISTIDISSDGKTMAGAGVAGNLYVWSIGDYSSFTVQVQKSSVSFGPLSFTPDGKYIVFGNQAGVVSMFKISEKVVWRQLFGHKYKVEEIAFSHSGKFMVTTSLDRTIRVWNLQNLSGQPITITGDLAFGSITFSPDDTQILAAPISSGESNKGSIKVWPLNMEQMVAELCGLVGRDFTSKERDIFCPPDLPYVPACPNSKR